MANEWLKLYKKRSFFVPYIIMAGFIALFAYLTQFMGTITNYLSAPQFAEVIISMKGLGQFLVILGVICTAGIVSREYQLGTIKFLLIRSVSRERILASKLVMALLYGFSLTMFSLVGSLVIGGLLFGFDGQGQGDELLRELIYQLVYMTVYIIVTFMNGVLTRSSGATIGISLAFIMLEGLIVSLMPRYEAIKYLFVAHTNLSVYENGGVPIAGVTMPFSLIMLAVYILLFLGVSFVTFKKRDVA